MVDPRPHLFMVSSRFFLLAATAVLVGICFHPRLLAQTQVNIGAMKDNTLYESVTGSVSNGAGEFFFVGRTFLGSIRRGLLAFDITGSVPAGARIDSVILTLHMSRTIWGLQSVSLHRLLAEWGEGTSDAGFNEGSGAPATPGDATWIHTFFDTTFWSNVGGDFAATPSATQLIDTMNAFYTWGSIPEMVTDVQGWLDSPSTNFGWLVHGVESTAQTSKRFDTRENLTPTFRPVLTVTYTPMTEVAESPQLPTELVLHQNYPNPFNPTTTIRYDLPVRSAVVLRIYNVVGQRIRTLVDETKPAGVHHALWDGRDDLGSLVSSGIYLCRLQAGSLIETRTMMLVK